MRYSPRCNWCHQHTTRYSVAHGLPLHEECEALYEATMYGEEKT